MSLALPELLVRRARAEELVAGGVACAARLSPGRLVRPVPRAPPAARARLARRALEEELVAAGVACAARLSPGRLVRPELLAPLVWPGLLARQALALSAALGACAAR